MSSDGAIKVSYQIIDQAGEDCKNAGNQIEQLFDQLQSQLQPLISTWEGDAMDAWHQRQNEWNRALDEMKSLLARIATALPQISEAYQQTDSGITKMFS
ncbi:MAG TPA: WXG100 family type VII secretion target [Pseudonocardia sp.]|jgi:WXG100 family type VII secretion target|nr:WXG100 family type VII secretion target [Pseudonocardia sp.]